ncbi:MAG: 4Fe-4S dicluster domain-containing protein [Candidatus Bathyarchaeia archaeon]
MPMKLQKLQTPQQIQLDRIHVPKHYTLILEKSLCQGCELCMLACPKEAIKIIKPQKTQGQKIQKPTIDIDETKCHYCGICNVICPYGAITVKVNGENLISVVEKESFPQLLREIEVDTTKCPPDCTDCEEACPLKLIKVTVYTPDGKPVENVKSLSKKDRKNLKVNVDIKREQCPCCRLCEFKCPKNAIHVKKIFYGTLQIRQEKCPENCQDCLDVCPITGALYWAEVDNKVHVDELYCVYCGICRQVCPVPEALELKRTSIRHTPVRSGAWNKALEKLASTTEMSKELKAKSLEKAVESVEKRLGWKVGV